MTSARATRQIIDVFLFNDEEGPLLARFLELSPHVDRFIGVEGNLTLSGKPRKLRLMEAVRRLGLPEDRFTCIVTPLNPADMPFDRERIQRDFAKDVLLSNYGPEAVILLSDVDEVPRGSSLEQAIESLDSGYRFVHFAQRMSVGYFNNFETKGRLLSYAGEYAETPRRERRWLGTVGFARRELDSGMTLSEMRYPARKMDGRRLANAGWHFSFCGGSLVETLSDRLGSKLQSFAHVEFSHLTNTSELEARLRKGKDILGRRFVRFQVADADEALSSAINSDPRLQNLRLREPTG